MTVNRTHSIKRRKITTNILYHTIISLISIGMLYPLLWMLSSSFKPNKEIFSTVEQLIPRHFTNSSHLHCIYNLKKRCLLPKYDSESGKIDYVSKAA